MTEEVSKQPQEGRTIKYDPRWITFERDDFGGIIIRTLTKHKTIEDSRRAEEIIKLLVELAEFDN